MPLLYTTTFQKWLSKHNIKHDVIVRALRTKEFDDSSTYPTLEYLFWDAMKRNAWDKERACDKAREKRRKKIDNFKHNPIVSKVFSILAGLIFIGIIEEIGIIG